MADWSRLVPLFLLFVFLGILGFVGFVVYSIVMDVKTQTEDKMKVKNVNLTREGVKIGVEDVNAEAEADKSQRWVYLFTLQYYLLPLLFAFRPILRGIFFVTVSLLWYILADRPAPDSIQHPRRRVEPCHLHPDTQAAKAPPREHGRDTEISGGIWTIHAACLLCDDDDDDGKHGGMELCRTTYVQNDLR